MVMTGEAATRHTSAFGRITRDGQVNPCLVVKPSLLRCAAMLLVSGSFTAMGLWLAAGGDGGQHGSVLTGKLFGVATVLLFGGGVYLVLRALAWWGGPTIRADENGISVVPGFGVMESVRWDQFQHCFHFGSGPRKAVHFGWEPRPGTSTRGRRRGYTEIMTTLLPISAEDLSDEILALQRYYLHRRDTPSAATDSEVYLSDAGLPPRPDRVTGLPRPPAAPGRDGSDEPGSTGSGPVPAPPPGQGPTLAHHAGHSTLFLTWMAVFFALIFMTPATLSDGTRWMGQPSMWAFIAACSISLAWFGRDRGCTAGADWLASGRRWVNVYELQRINQHTVMNDRWLSLRDSHGRRVRVKLEELHGDPQVWDLVYNGMLHSTITGQALLDHRRHRILRLPYPAPS